MCRLTPAPTWPRQVALSSDEAVFGGYENASKKYNTEYQTQEGTYDNRPNSFQVTGLSTLVARPSASCSFVLVLLRG